MIRRFFFAAFFGTLVGLAAASLGFTAGSKIQAVMVGLVSALGFLAATLMARSRVRRSQGVAPALHDGERVILYGPGDLEDSGGSSKAWFYVTSERLMLRSGEGEGLDLAWAEIEELRPPQQGLFSGEIQLVARGRGLLRLKVPDAPRWHAAFSQAIHKK